MKDMSSKKKKQLSIILYKSQGEEEVGERTNLQNIYKKIGSRDRASTEKGSGGTTRTGIGIGDTAKS